MSFSPFAPALRPWAIRHAAQNILVYIHFTSPIILLTFFLVAFVAHGIATASKDVIVVVSKDQTGPGGKPLPQDNSASVQAKRTKQTLDLSPARKLLFVCLSVGTILTLVGNAVVVVLHAVLDRKNNWWCGQSVAV